MLRIEFPHDGDVLTRHDGVETGDALRVVVTGTCAGPTVTVNGYPAKVDSGRFACEVPIARRRQAITVQADGESVEIEVWWDRASRRRCRFSIDDNILFLRDLGLAPDRYLSLFDHDYLAFWREMHREFGTKVHFNIYYQTDGFDLTQMPDRWKEEWQENADWIRLSFHALQDKPDRPYRHARYAQIAHDYDLVCGHIRRFAGNELIGTTTTVHWAECPRDGVAALRDRGIERLIGLFWPMDGAWTTGYYLSPEDYERVDRRPAWHDRETGMMFVPCAAVVNALEVERIEPHLDARAAREPASDMLELLIHEQYFRQDLPLYQPTVKDKVRTALRWATRNGYEPTFWGDGFLGNTAAMPTAKEDTA